MEVTKDLLTIELERFELEDLIADIEAAKGALDDSPIPGSGQLADRLAYWQVTLKGLVK